MCIRIYLFISTVVELFFSEIWTRCCLKKCVLEIVTLRELGLGVMVFNATFNNISVISWRSVSLEETGVPGEKHQPVVSHWQTISHHGISSTPIAWAGYELITLVVIGTDCRWTFGGLLTYVTYLWRMGRPERWSIPGSGLRPRPLCWLPIIIDISQRALCNP